MNNMETQMYTSTKYFKELGPCAYRNWRSNTDCYLLHGYARSFRFVFGARTLDAQGFVVDFGGLKEVQRQLKAWFDHTVILQSDDPLVHVFEELSQLGHLRLVTFPLISSEGLAQWVGEYVHEFLQHATDGRAWVEQCEMIEAEKNSAYYNLFPEHPDRLTFRDLLQLNAEMLHAAPRIELGRL